MRKVKIGKAAVSRLCIGGNPFSGFSHQGEERNQEMIEYYTPDRIEETLNNAEKAGVNTFFGRTDNHILEILKDYWGKGGTIQWFAQVCGDPDDPAGWKKWLKASIKLGATGAYLHGGIVDYWHANGMFDNFREALDLMRTAGVAAGFAGHSSYAHKWINDNLDVDFQMCSHYIPTDRSNSPHHISVGEEWNDKDRKRMLKTTSSIEQPVVHHKVFAGGNKPIIPAFELLGRVVRPQDVVLIGVYTKDNPNMINEDVLLFEQYVEKM